MPLVIPDNLLQQAGLTASDALLEFACRLFDAEKLDLWLAAAFCGLDRLAFINELQKRGISVFRPTLGDVEHDCETLVKLGI